MNSQKRCIIIDRISRPPDYCPRGRPAIRPSPRQNLSRHSARPPPSPSPTASWPFSKTGKSQQGFVLTATARLSSVPSVKELTLILMGAGSLACPLLTALLEQKRDRLAAVVTPPDRPAGRGRQLHPCPLKQKAQLLGLPVLTPENVNAPEFLGDLTLLKPDLIIVASYGQFLRLALLALPRLGPINVHPSLLPKYRGASPIQWALANGETETGVSVVTVTPRMDAGDILAQERMAISPTDTFLTLEPRLAALGAKLLLAVLDNFRAGHTQGIPQDESQATFARKLTKEDGRVNWNLPATVICNRLRGFASWPGTYTFLPDGGALKLHAVEVETPPALAAPGTVLETAGKGPLIAAGTDALRLTAVQPAGKKPMSGAEFIRGHRLQIGERLDPLFPAEP